MDTLLGEPNNIKIIIEEYIKIEDYIKIIIDRTGPSSALSASIVSQLVDSVYLPFLHSMCSTVLSTCRNGRVSQVLHGRLSSCSRIIRSINMPIGFVSFFRSFVFIFHWSEQEQKQGWGDNLEVINMIDNTFYH